MLDYLADKGDDQALRDAAFLVEQAVESGFARNRLRPAEFGGDQGTREVTGNVLELITEVQA